jgi:hypothetical protein
MTILTIKVGTPLTEKIKDRKEKKKVILLFLWVVGFGFRLVFGIVF